MSMHKINYEEYNTIIEDTIEKVKNILLVKGKEYGTNDDPLHNFRAATQMMNMDIKQVLAGYMMKHTVSVYNMIENSKGPGTYSTEKWEEKIIDHINYLLILRACIGEEKLNNMNTYKLPLDTKDIKNEQWIYGDKPTSED